MTYDHWKLDTPPEASDTDFDRWCETLEELIDRDAPDCDNVTQLYQDGLSPEQAARKINERKPT